MNSILSDYMSESRKTPKDMEEMVRLKLIRAIPAAPPGKKYVLDQNKRRVILVDLR
ncbi:MAG: hypothetical protein HY300_00955 [Verrucomicrobia bacterium]|nr:hypothetical protein [Verrucomicrobiota bacterium]